MTITTPEGNRFILYENDVVTIDLFSSLFTEDGELKGSYSYSGKAPLIPNKKLIAYGDMLEVNTSGKLTGLQVQLGNIYWTDVNMLYQVNDQTEIEFSLTLNLSLINDRLKKTSLTQIPFPTHYLGSTELEIQNSMMQASQSFDWNDSPYTFAPVTAPRFAGQPQDAEADEGVISTDGYVNSMRVENDEMVFNAPNRLADSRLKYIVVPYFYLNFVLKQLANFLGFQIGGEVMTDTETSKIVIYNINQAFIPLDSIGMYVTASDHLPDITAAEFLKNLSQWGIYPLLSAHTNELLFKFKKDYRNSVVKDWSGKAVNFKTVESEPYGGYSIKVESPVIRPDQTVIEGNVFEGNAENEIELKITTLMSDYDTGRSAGWRWLVPFDNSEGNILDPNYSNLGNFTSVTDKQEFPLCFLYYLGWRQFLEYPFYPKLSAINDDSGKNLYLTGVYEEYLIDFMKATEGAKEVQIDFRLNSIDVANWQDDDIIHVKSRSGVSVSILLKKLTVDIKANSYLYEARGEGIVIKSTSYTDIPKDRLFIRYRITNITNEGPYLPTMCDVVIELFNDKACQAPYTGGETIPVDLVISGKTKDVQSDNLSDDDDVTIRIVMTSQSYSYHTLFQHIYIVPDVGSMIEYKSFSINESPHFYIV